MKHETFASLKFEAKGQLFRFLLFRIILHNVVVRESGILIEMKWTSIWTQYLLGPISTPQNNLGISSYSPIIKAHINAHLTFMFDDTLCEAFRVRLSRSNLLNSFLLIHCDAVILWHVVLSRNFLECWLPPQV